MESTLLEPFLMTSKLKCWISKPDCPPVIKECRELFNKVYASKILDNDDSVTVEEATTMPIHSTSAELHVLLKDAQEVAMCARMRHNSSVYSSSKYLYPHGDRALSSIPSSIKYVCCEGQTAYLGVQHQLSLENAVLNTFAHYPPFPARVYSSSLSQTLEQVQPDWIFSHYVWMNFTANHAVVLSFNRAYVKSHPEQSGIDIYIVS